MRSPSAQGAANSPACQAATSASAPARAAHCQRYSSPPRPMPARISPKPYRELPSSGASMRNQTSSLRKKLKPVMPAASPPMKTASTAAVAGVAPPKTRRSSRSQAIW